MTTDQAIEWVQEEGVVLEAAEGPVPCLAWKVAGESIQGSWWSHAASHEIFALTRALRASPDVLVCRLISGKVTYVHRRLWPAIIRLADDIGHVRLTAIREIHTERGSHRVEETPFPQWVSSVEMQAASQLAHDDAVQALHGIPSILRG